MAALDLNNTFGALLIGIVLSAVLFGVTCVQTFYYFQNYPQDHFMVKVAVAFLLILESLHSAFSIHAIYYYTILNFAHPSALLEATWSAAMTIGISSGIMLIAHLFYVRRVYNVSRKNIPLVVAILLLAIAHTGMNLAVTILAFRLKFYASFIQITGIVDASLSLAIVTDITIAASLTYYLNSSRSGIQSTDTIINKLLIYTINNGVITSVFDIVVIIFVTVEPHNLIFLAIFQIVGNLYTNSMLATLNSRRSISEPLTQNSVTLFKLTRSGDAATTSAPDYSNSAKDGIKNSMTVV